MTRAQMLLNAVQCAIANKCERRSISVPEWARTYRVSQAEVRRVWEAELTKACNANYGDAK
jgi:hypothetical protein